MINHINNCRSDIAQLCRTLIPLTVVHQAPLSMAFSKQEYWSGLPFPSPGDLPDLGIKPRFPALWADALPSEQPGKPNNCRRQVKTTMPYPKFKSLTLWSINRDGKQ